VWARVSGCVCAVRELAAHTYSMRPNAVPPPPPRWNGHAAHSSLLCCMEVVEPGSAMRQFRMADMAHAQRMRAPCTPHAWGAWRMAPHAPPPPPVAPLTVVRAPILVGHPSCLLHVVQDVREVEQVAQDGEVLLVPQELPPLWVLVYGLAAFCHVARDLRANVGRGREDDDVLVVSMQVQVQVSGGAVG
jgi:hypothetical protein